eukprot:TRINITY_DN450_c0_g1_i1.p1 TRINITY_DN450_c0_g1~~TRINITY_DN450_c0_g1_i1.p1  ORF type:complete len:402 (-),score=138.27 TRINITY_DN450_c0_g1_i1:53-1228(-)
MGINGLTKLLGDNTQNCIKENEIKNYFGRKIAVDASMSLYQFLIAIQQLGPDSVMSTLTDASGETTAHLQGLFHRTIRMMANGIKPVFVFDGKAPEMKSDELEKRREKRAEAEEKIKTAKETGDDEAVAKYAKRTVRVTSKHNDEAKRLLKLMGIPIVESPGEAEAQCAAMAKAGIVYATGTEDMDSLTLGTPILLRHLTFSEARKMPILEIHLDAALTELGLTFDQFIDLCILLGCDYSKKISGIGPVRALEYIRKYGNLETIIKHLDSTKYQVPEGFDPDKIREMFKNPLVQDPATIQLKWTDPDEEGLIQFLVEEKGFAAERIKAGIEKLKKQRSTSVQDRLTSYFKTTTVPSPNKRKPEPSKEKNGKKAKLGVKASPAKGSPAKKKK